MASLVAWWKGENSTADSQGNLTTNWHDSSTYTTGQVGNAFRISYGNGDRWGLDATASNPIYNFPSNSSFSIRFWLKFNTRSFGNPLWVVIKNGRWAVSTNDYGVAIATNGNLSILTSSNSMTGTAAFITDTTAFHDVVVTYNNGYYKAYLDGSNVTGSNFGTQHLCGTNSGPLYIGQCYFPGTSGVDFIVDELKLYDYDISNPPQKNVVLSCTDA